jgi:predicted nucleotidyltransferase
MPVFFLIICPGVHVPQGYPPTYYFIVMNTQVLIHQIAEQISRVEGVCAVVLGGSRARGTQTPTSDIDLGIYYQPDLPLDLAALTRLAQELDDSHRPDLLTATSGWGPWINGGGWLSVESIPVDFLYRDLGKVTAVINACHAGQVEMFYQPGHPHGFASSIYMAEIAVCQPLQDRQGKIAALKASTWPYPPALKKALVEKFAWEAGFALGTAGKSVKRGDVAYVAGCCFRSVMCMLQVIFALNGQYWLNEKGAVTLADSFSLRPSDLKNRIESAFGNLQADPESLATATHILVELVEDMSHLDTGI